MLDESWRNIGWGELLVGALLALGGSIVFDYYTAESPELAFEEFPPAHFTSQASEVSIYNVAVDNVGNKEASDVKVHLVLPFDAIIQDLQVKPSSNAIDYEILKPDATNIRQIRFPLLNAGEGARFSLLINKGGDAQLTVEVRGNGVVGHAKDDNEDGGLAYLRVMLPFFAAFIAVLGAVWLKKITQLQELLQRSSSQQLRVLRTQKSPPAAKGMTQKDIVQLLTERPWRLFYNPSAPGKSKLMRFAANGVIAEGSNQNEAVWRVQGDFLELMNSQGRVHSRFYYSPADLRFYHTNDPDTGSIIKHGIKDQYIAPEE